MRIDKLSNAIYSPQWVAELLHYFLSGAQFIKKDGIKLELIYLVLPFIYDDIIRSKLITSTIKANMATVFFAKSPLEMKSTLQEKNVQFERFKKVTQNGLIYLSKKNNILINNHILIENTIHYKDIKNDKKDYIKAAYQLGAILAKENYINIFLKFRITNI